MKYDFFTVENRDYDYNCGEYTSIREALRAYRKEAKENFCCSIGLYGMKAGSGDDEEEDVRDCLRMSSFEGMEEEDG